MMRRDGCRPMREPCPLLAMVMLLSAVLSEAVLPATIRVPEDESNLQRALNLVMPGDTVSVGPGSYQQFPDLPGGVTLLGREGAGTTILYGADEATLITVIDNTLASEINGFTLAYGKSARGGAIRVDQAPLIIKNCVFSHNRAFYGNGPGKGNAVYAQQSPDLRIEDCQFLDNRSWVSGEAATVHLDGGEQFHLERCRFLRNDPLDLSTSGTVTVVLIGNLFTNDVVIGTPRHQIIESNLFYDAGTLEAQHTPLDHRVFCNAFWQTSVSGAGMETAFFDSCTVREDPHLCVPIFASPTAHVLSPLLPGNHPRGCDCSAIGNFEAGCTTVVLISITPSRLTYSGREELTVAGYRLDELDSWTLTSAGFDSIPIDPLVLPAGRAAIFPSPFYGREPAIYTLEAATLEGEMLRLENSIEVVQGNITSVVYDTDWILNHVPVTIHGRSFLLGLDLWLESRLTGELLRPFEMCVLEPDSIEAIFDLTQASLGVYNLHIENPNQDHLFMEEAFTIPAGRVLTVPGDAGTIQGAIDIAVSGVKIEIEPGTYYEALDFGGKFLELEGTQGSDETIITGAGWHRPVITIPPAAPRPCFLSGLTITGGEAERGGGLYAEGVSLIVSDCTFLQNRSTLRDDSVCGGAIYASGADSLILQRCRFHGNQAESPSGSAVDVDDAAYYAVMRCRFTLNAPADLQAQNAPRIGLVDNIFTRSVRVKDPVWQTINHNLFYCADTLIAARDSDERRVSCNDFWNTGAYGEGMTHIRTSYGNFQEDPLFCDMTLRDFSVHALSPLLAENRTAGMGDDCDTIAGVSIGCDDPVVSGVSPREVDYLGRDTLTISGWELGTIQDWHFTSEHDALDFPVEPIVSADGRSAKIPSPFYAAPAGVYDLEATHQNGDVQRLKSSLRVLSGALSSITPDNGRAFDSVRVGIRGYPILLNGQASLRCVATGESYAGIEQTIWQPDSIHALFDLSDAIIGKYNMEVQNPNGDLLVLEEAFTLLGYSILRVPEEYPTIQAAIDGALDGVKILVGPGEYNESISFQGKSIRLLSTDGPEVTTITAAGLNQRVVTIQEECGTFAELGGFTLTGGRQRIGAGLRCDAPALVQGCIIENNLAEGDSSSYSPCGGGIYADNHSRVIGNIIQNNHSVEISPGHWPTNPCDSYHGSGGGVCCSDAGLERNLIQNNGSPNGGGIYAVSSEVTGNKIRNNHSYSNVDPYDDCWNFGGIGGLSARAGSFIRGNLFSNNSGLPGDLGTSGQCTILKNLFDSSYPESEFSEGDLVERNSFISLGGEGYIWQYPHQAIHWTGNIFVGIYVGEGVPLPTLLETQHHIQSRPPIRPSGGDPAEITESKSIEPDFAGNILYRSGVSSDIRNNFPNWADSNLVADPLFCDFQNGDYRIGPGSPALPFNNAIGWPDTIGAYGIGCDAVPLLMWGLDAEWVDKRVQLTWFIAHDIDPPALHIDRREWPEGEPARLTSVSLPVCTTCTFIDPDPPRDVALLYALVMILPDGSEQILGAVDLNPGRVLLDFSKPAPNPCAGATTFRLQAPPGLPVTVTIYDTAGRKIRSLWRGPVLENPQIILWDGKTENGHPAGSGIYFARVSGPKTIVRRVTMIR
ncbi:MAG: hypothetical protein KJ970_01985 [Candidatus Eisenbacteria bacterium]|uniref:T9SS type A sorting domain-containing protein n=1 Tax=Eiseniibacteriota bacterium TaxID=2212470 RepID=A0A948W5K0_UNCEI|nr:hypothetical protein [Candidatus Eisenbacteria bacterium]MBU1948203.1 hypothetical protein [Candidatus Eisenbacteria bacterium]MBU2689666.1 hypothetical protein [Candidatus Eisenbacteria bacterium]